MNNVYKCKYIYKRGLKKGEECTNKANSENSLFCSIHLNSDASNIQLKQLAHDKLKIKILQIDTCSENKNVIIRHYNNMLRCDYLSTEYYKNNMFIERALSFPWNKFYSIKGMIGDSSIKSFINYVETCFDREIHGMENVKNELINMICKFITNPNTVRNNIALYGDAGIGKSKFVKVLSNVLDIPLKIIPLGGVRDPSFFTGHGYVYVESGPGKIIQNIIDSKVANPIIYFDELDKVSESEKGNDVYSFLTYLTDPTQNNEFSDQYFYGMKFDLSKVLYIFTFNDINKIDKILLDRLNIIYVNSPSEKEIIIILKKHCIPEICRNIGISQKVIFTEYQLIRLIRKFNNFKMSGCSGVRMYYKLIEKILLEINKEILLSDIGHEITSNLNITDINYDKYLSIIGSQTTKQETFACSHMYT